MVWYFCSTEEMADLGESEGADLEESDFGWGNQYGS
jgi:hypothetical protein